MSSSNACAAVSTAETLVTDGEYLARLALAADAQPLVEMFEAALGAGGVGAPGCEPYPDPSLFDVPSMAENLAAGRILVLVEAVATGIVAGAITLDVLGPYQIENNCMAVRRDLRGRGIGSLLMRGVSAYLSRQDLMINCTELVTHSLASQAAHVADGYGAFCGFGYSHYPNVFFADRPESVLWTWRAYGEALAEQPKRDTEVARLLRSIKEKRTVFVAPRYDAICRRIAKQFEPLLAYHFADSGDAKPEGKAEPGAQSLTLAQLVVQRNDGYEHGYVICPEQLTGSDVAQVENAVRELLSLKKRFIAVRIPANSSICPALTERLREMGFAFHSFLPLYGWNEETRSFFDVFTMQYVQPSVAAGNPLPGETNSVIKIYGYPANITGAIVHTVAADLRERSALNAARERTRDYHEQYYGRHELYAPGSWLAQSDPRLPALAAGLTAESRVLDLGCGVGRNTIELTKRCGAHVTAVDILPSAIEKLTAYASRHGVSERVLAICSEMEEFALEADSFDLILAVSAIEHVGSMPTLRRLLSQIAGATRAGGRVLITTSTGRNVADAVTGEPVETKVETPLTATQAVELLEGVFRNWGIEVLETAPYRERIELDGQDVLWQSTEVNFLARKPPVAQR